MRRSLAWLLPLALALGCTKKDPPRPAPATAPSSQPSSTTAKDDAPLTLAIAYGSEKKTWFSEQVKLFIGTDPRTKSGRKIVVAAVPMGSGEAMQAILAGKVKPHIFSPASGVYVTLLNDAWMSTGGHTKPLCAAGDPLVLSPIVIAMWKPMAQALGWPDKPIGWADLLKVAANPKGWGALGHPEWGQFKLGHTHPEHSNSGILAVLAEAYAGAGKLRGLTRDDLATDGVVKQVTAVEQTILHYGKSTGFFADKMIERGPSYLSAAVLYENLVIESYDKSPRVPLVAIYPTEGTFWSDHPFAVLDAEWVGAEDREAAAQLLAFLKARPAQERALALGFRPADPAIATAAPIDEAHGVDPRQPQTLLEVPDGPTLVALLDVWRKHKKSTDVILVFDKSGSMTGPPLDQAKVGARAFLEALHDSDEVTLLFFDSKVYPPVGPARLGEKRADVAGRIEMVEAGGGTALYDAVARAITEARGRAKREPGRIHAVVVMTDGKDESSKLKLAALLPQLGGAEEDAALAVKVFTIAYGAAADPTVLAQIAEAAKGATATGSLETISKVFEDMGAFL